MPRDSVPAGDVLCRDAACDIGAFEFSDGEVCYVINSNGGKAIVFCL